MLKVVLFVPGLVFLYIHNFTDFKQYFGGVWHDGLWNTTTVGILVELINIIKSLYNSTKISIPLINYIGFPFTMKVGLRQGYFLSPILFNIFLEIIMQDTLENHQSTCVNRNSNIRTINFLLTIHW